jgi:solute carrier family 5 (sodium-coupled monocarboxylate transporter), member 8/12
MKVIPVGCSLVATWVSAIGLFGTTAETYVFGAEYCWLLLPLFVLGLAMHFLYLPVFQGLKLTSAHQVSSD